MKTFEVEERSSAQYKATLKDEAGSVIALSDLTTITATIYSEDSSTKAVINSRNAQDIKNANGGTFHATSGLLTLDLSEADNQVLDSALPRERHIVQLDFTYNGGAKTGRHRVRLVTLNLAKVS